MRVVTFNIHHGTVGTDGPVDPVLLGEVCAGFDADLVALQEVDRGTFRSGRVDLAAAAAEICGMQHVFGASTRFWGGWFGNALLVRGDLVSSSVTGLPRVPWWKRRQERRTLLRAEVQVDGQPWSVAVTHLAVGRAINGPQLDRVLGLVQRDQHPLVVLGDLNSRANAVEPAAASAGLVCVPHGPTYPVQDPRRDIDHVLVSPELRVGRVEVRRTPVSDHAALLVDLER